MYAPKHDPAFSFGVTFKAWVQRFPFEPEVPRRFWPLGPLYSTVGTGRPSCLGIMVFFRIDSQVCNVRTSTGVFSTFPIRLSFISLFGLPLFLQANRSAAWCLTDDHQNIPTSFSLENSLVCSECLCWHCPAWDKESSTCVVASPDLSEIVVKMPQLALSLHS